MNELALFAGAGGGILAGHLLGWRTVCAVEINAYAAGVLCARQNDGILPPFPIWDDVCTFDGRPWRGIVDVVSGGFPCQDISCAGKGEGLDGERSGLWREFARIIGEVRPRFAFVENSPMLTVRGLHRVLGDLAEMGYDAEWGIVSAADAGAPHLRERIWIVADSCGARRWKNSRGAYGDEKAYAGRTEAQTDQPYGHGEGGGAGIVADSPSERCGEAGRFRRGESAQRTGGGGEDVPYSNLQHVDRGGHGSGAIPLLETSELRGSENVSYSPGEGLEIGIYLGADAGEKQPAAGGGGEVVDAASLGRGDGRAESEIRGGRDSAAGAGWWAAEPDVGRVAHGVAARVERLRAIGNGQVPGVARIAWEILTRRAIA